MVVEIRNGDPKSGKFVWVGKARNYLASHRNGMIVVSGWNFRAPVPGAGHFTFYSGDRDAGDLF